MLLILLMLVMLLMLLMEQVMVSMMVVIVRTLMLVSDTSHKQEAAQCHSTLHLVMVTEHLDPCHQPLTSLFSNSIHFASFYLSSDK